MMLALLLLLQDKVEMAEFKTSYLVVRPASYSDRESWPVIVDLNTGKDPIREPDCFVLAPGRGGGRGGGFCPPLPRRPEDESSRESRDGRRSRRDRGARPGGRPSG